MTATIEDIKQGILESWGTPHPMNHEELQEISSTIAFTALNTLETTPDADPISSLAITLFINGMMAAAAGWTIGTLDGDPDSYVGMVSPRTAMKRVKQFHAEQTSTWIGEE